MPFYSRKSPRLAGYDYSKCGMYFVTICTHEKRCLFGKTDMINTYGCIAETELLDAVTHYKGVSVEKYVIMPNHVHAIVSIDSAAANPPTLSTIIGGYKSAVSRKIHKTDPDLVVWQRTFYERVIRDENEFLNVWKYIDENPMKWELDEYHTP